MAGIFLRTRHFHSQLVGGDHKRTRAMADSSPADDSDAKRKKDGGDDDGDDVASGILGFIRSAAIGMYDMEEEDWEWKRCALAMRKMMFADLDGHQLPFLKKKKKKKKKYKLSEHNGGSSSRGIMNLPTRRSSRKVLKLGDSELPRKRVPIDSAFQADVPDWTGPPTAEEDPYASILYDRKLIGAKFWPMEHDSREVVEGVPGNGRSSSCFCTFPGSAECVRFHVNMSRIKLICELGQSFPSFGFVSMGEEVSKLWTQEEQIKFDDLVRENPISEGKSFLEPALAYFKNKTRKDIVSFYYNVFLLRWMGLRTRAGLEAVESDDTYLRPENCCSD